MSVQPFMNGTTFIPFESFETLTLIDQILELKCLLFLFYALRN